MTYLDNAVGDVVHIWDSTNGLHLHKLPVTFETTFEVVFSENCRPLATGFLKIL